jgi:L-rhamnose isomerase
VGARAALKALLAGLLEPRSTLVACEAAGDYLGRLQTFELARTLPLGAVWDWYCLEAGVPTEVELLGAVREYDAAVSRRRG